MFFSADIMREQDHQIPFKNGRSFGNSCSYVLTGLRKFVQEAYPSTWKSEALPMFCVRSFSKRITGCIFFLNEKQAVMDFGQRNIKWVDVLDLEDFFYALVKGDPRLSDLGE